VRLSREPGATFRSLRNRNYRLYISGIALSSVGTWMQAVAQGWLILELTGGSGGALGITTALQFMPALLFGLWAGVIVDRYPKRLILMVSQTAMGALALILGMLTVTGAVRLWHIYALAFALGLARLVDDPTRQSFVVELVDPDDRANAIALEGAAMTSARIVGPAVAGVLIDIIGIGPVFLVNGISFAVMIAGLKLVRDGDLHAAPRSSRMKGQLRAGLAYVRGRGDLVLVFTLVGFVAAFGMNPQITTPLMTKNVFHADARSFGLASTVFAAGSLAGTLLAARTSRPTRRLMLSAALLFGVLEALSALLPTYASFLILLAPTGLMVVIFTTSAIVTMQLDVTPEMRGRVSGLYYLIFTGTTPIGAPMIGWFAQVLGARAGLLVGGGVTILATVGIAPLLLRHGRAKTAPALDSTPLSGSSRQLIVHQRSKR
jgi:MFS family permease